MIRQAGLLTLLSVSIAVFSVDAAAQSDNGVSSRHRPNEHTLACLEDISRDCSFRAAIQTAIDEELGLEKSKILVGVARSMVRLGDTDRALRTLELAIEEARSARLSLVMQEKIRTIAPLMAEAGDIASALALAEEVQIAGVKDRVLEEIALNAARKGDVASALVALDQVSAPRRAFWRRMEVYLYAPVSMLPAVDLLPFVEGIEAEGTPAANYRGLITLGLIERRRGNAAVAEQFFAQADAIFATVVSSELQAELLSLKLRAFYESGADSGELDGIFSDLAAPRGRLSRFSMEALSRRVGPIEAATGRAAAALLRLEQMNDLTEKARYLGSLSTGEPIAAHKAAITEVLGELSELESAYERDNLRLSLLDAAVGAQDLEMGIEIVRMLEDDDNQALGLALLAPLLEA